jgi:hypothetical protein
VMLRRSYSLARKCLMKTGDKLMSLKTRLDGRSLENASFQIKNEDGELLATISVADKSPTMLDIDTPKGYYIEKPNGWNSKRT